MQLPNWTLRRALSHPDLPALICSEGSWSFAQLHAEAATLARRLWAAGVRPGARVAVLARPGPLVVALVHAMPLLGSTLLPLNTRLTQAELRFQLSDSTPDLFISDTAFATTALALREQLPAGAVLSDQPAQGLEPLPAPATDAPLSELIDLDAIHTLIYTSGTSGRPKGALLSYGNHWWSAIGSALNLGLHADDRWLAVLPLFHVGGLAILLRGAIYGMPVVLGSSDAQAINTAIDEQHITVVSLVSSLLTRLLDARGGRAFPTWLRCVLLGGGPAPRALLERAASQGLAVAQTYGMTETASQCVTLAPSDALRKPGSAGLPLLPNELRILDQEQPVPPGQIGEIVVRGPSVSQRYLGRPAHLRDGWLATGDLGYLDDDGYLYVVDRRDDLIISGGENIYPAEIEAILQAHPAVLEAGVIGSPDAEWGQVPQAFVVLREGSTATSAELHAHCAANLARYKLPRSIQIIEALPRNAAGKLLRRSLKDPR